MTHINGAHPTSLQDAIVSKEFHAIRGSASVACFLVLTNGLAVVGMSHNAANPHASMAESLADAESKVPEAMTQRSPHGDH